MIALESSTFTLKKIKYYKTKWLKDHISIVVSIISWIVLLVALKIEKVGMELIGTIGGLLTVLFYVVIYNRLMKYVEDNVYRKINNTLFNEL